MEFANVPVQGWIIDPKVHGLLDSPSGVVCLPAQYGEIVQTDSMPRGVTMIIDGGRGLEMFFHPFPKSPCRLPYILLVAIHLVTHIPVDYPIVSNINPFLGGHKEIPDSVASFEMDLDPCLLTNILKVFVKSLWCMGPPCKCSIVIVADWVVVVVLLGLVNALSIVTIGLQSILSPSGLLASV